MDLGSTCLIEKKMTTILGSTKAATEKVWPMSKFSEKKETLGFWNSRKILEILLEKKKGSWCKRELPSVQGQED